jgi:hypothetical protein
VTKPAVIITFLTVLLSGANCAVAKGRWITLFDGKSTDAWRCFKGDSFPQGSWKVENGILKTVPGAENRCDIITKEKFKNYELELEWSVTPGGNSGVIYNVSEEGDAVWHTGPEMQILDDEKHRDGQNPKTSAGALYALVAPTGKVLKPVGQFNRARLIVRGNRVEHWLNGRKIVSYQFGSQDLAKLIADSKFKDLPRFAKVSEGHVSLQHHGEEVWFRNVRIRRLD